MVKGLCLFAVFLLVLTGCGADETPTRVNDFTPLTSIVITSVVVMLPVGVSTQLVAMGNFSGLFTREITSQVTWSSAQPSTADFPPDFPPGRVKALVAGPATISATQNGIIATSNLTVSDTGITTLFVEPQLPSLPLGLSQFFTVKGTFSDATTRDLTFDAFWMSTDNSVAIISNNIDSKGEVSALKLGTTEISATFAGVSAATTLTITEPIPVSINIESFTSSQLTLTSQTFTATGTYSDKSSRDITTDVTWSSTNTAVATIAADGTVKTRTPGITTISANIGEIFATTNLKATGGSLTKIDFILDQTEQIKGTSSRVIALGTFDNNTFRDITGAIETWEVDNTKASVIVDSGNLVWLKALDITIATGTTLSAKYGTLTGSSPVVITAPILASGGLLIPNPIITLSTGTSADLSLSGSFTPANSQDLSLSADWSSANLAIATVNNVGLDKGRVHALTTGTSVITASYGNQTTTTTVTVDSRTLQDFTLSADVNPGARIAGRQEQFTVIANYATGSPQDVTADATWTINNFNVINFSDKLSDPGLVVAVDAGSAILTVTFGGKTVTENIVVVAAP